MLAKPKLARRSTAVMVFVAGMDGFGKVQKVAHFSRLVIASQEDDCPIWTTLQLAYLICDLLPYISAMLILGNCHQKQTAPTAGFFPLVSHLIFLT